MQLELNGGDVKCLRTPMWGIYVITPSSCHHITPSSRHHITHIQSSMIAVASRSRLKTSHPPEVDDGPAMLQQLARGGGRSGAMRSTYGAKACEHTLCHTQARTLRCHTPCFPLCHTRTLGCTRLYPHLIARTLTHGRARDSPTHKTWCVLDAPTRPTL